MEFPEILTNSRRKPQVTTIQTPTGSHVGFEYRGRLPSYVTLPLHRGSGEDGSLF